MLSLGRARLCPRLATKLAITRSPQRRFQSSTSGWKESGPNDLLKYGAVFTVTVGVFGSIVYAYFDHKAKTKDVVPHVLMPERYTGAVVTSSEPSGPDTKLITLTIPLRPDMREIEELGPIWSVYIKDDDIQVERPYTPLEGMDRKGRMVFWVKKYPQGEVGRWLHGKKVGDVVGLRGPLRTWLWNQWYEESWDEVVLISGGTGITPMYQLFHNVISRPPTSPSSSDPASPPKHTRFTLLHSSPSSSALPPQPMLERLQSFAESNPERFRLKLFVDKNDDERQGLRVGQIRQGDIEQAVGAGGGWWGALFGSLRTTEAIEKEQESKKRVLFLVCGPDPMVGAIAGPFGRNFSQGSVGGVLGKLGYTSNQVWKL